jgi:Fe-S cluster biogenesis protein NfuA
MPDYKQEKIVEHIKQVLEQYVDPVVAQHGGVVNFSAFDNGIVLLEMSGACSGCAGSTMTLKYGAEQILTQMVPEVEAVEGFDDPLSNNPFYDPMYYDMIETIDLEDDTDA